MSFGIKGTQSKGKQLLNLLRSYFRKKKQQKQNKIKTKGKMFVTSNGQEFSYRNDQKVEDNPNARSNVDVDPLIRCEPCYILSCKRRAPCLPIFPIMLSGAQYSSEILKSTHHLQE